MFSFFFSLSILNVACTLEYASRTEKPKEARTREVGQTPRSRAHQGGDQFLYRFDNGAKLARLYHRLRLLHILVGERCGSFKILVISSILPSNY